MFFTVNFKRFCISFKMHFVCWYKKNKLPVHSSRSCWIGRHHLIPTWLLLCSFALCGRGWVWKLGRCRSQTCADKYFTARTLACLSASVHRAPVPLTSHTKYRYKQANTLMRTNCIKELQSTGNLFLPPAALPQTAASSRSSTGAEATATARGQRPGRVS